MYSGTVIGATKERYVDTLKKCYWGGARIQAGEAEPWAERVAGEIDSWGVSYHRAFLV